MQHIDASNRGVSATARAGDVSPQNASAYFNGTFEADWATVRPEATTTTKPPTTRAHDTTRAPTTQSPTPRRRRLKWWAAAAAALALALAVYGVFATNLNIIGESGTFDASGTAPTVSTSLGCQTQTITISPAYREDFYTTTGFDIPILGFDLTGLEASCLGTGTPPGSRSPYSVILAVELPIEGFRELSLPLNLGDAQPVPGSSPTAYRVSPTGITSAESVQITGYSLRLAGGNAPTAPILTAATPGNTTATLTWTAPENPGSTAITGYQYSINNGTSWATATTGSPLIIGGLTNNVTYTVAVRAVNATGPGPTSNTLTVTPLAEDENIPADVIIAGDQTGL